MIVYFTGTGNSRYCADLLADLLSDESVDAFSLIQTGMAARLSSDRPWVFVAPTYGWQLPRIFVDFIRAGCFQGSRDAYFAMTCGSEIGDAARANEALCAEKGLRYLGTLSVVMPENYIALFDAPEPQEARRIIVAAHPVLKAGAARILAGAALDAPKAALADRIKSGPVNAAFYRFIVKAKGFAVQNTCTQCGKCAKLCPLDNITLKDGRPVWGNACTHCMACICGCPASAIEYGKKTAGKPRYQCPPYLG